MGLLAGLAELVSPTRCAGCELPGQLLCPGCTSYATRFEPDHDCPRCGAPHGALVCTECWERSFAFDSAAALGELAPPLSRAVVLHKDGGERRLGAALGALIAAKTAALWSDWPEAVTWIPATRAAVVRRGFDHARALALPVAARHEVPALELLGRTAARDQRALGRAERAANAAGTFTVLEGVPARVLVVDDVLTTGATLDAASEALLAAGAAEVRVAVVARAW